jgi:hypothetical protein
MPAGTQAGKGNIGHQPQVYTRHHRKDCPTDDTKQQAPNQQAHKFLSITHDFYLLGHIVRATMPLLQIILQSYTIFYIGFILK